MAGDLSLDFLATGSTGEDLSLDIRAVLSGLLAEVCAAWAGVELGAGLSGVGLRLDLAAGLSGVDLRLDFLAGV